jgi:hypothetical protein
MSWTSKGFKAQGASWASPGFSQTPAHPVVGVNAYDALEFCRWLTDKDRAAGLIDERLAYRLPTETEWRKAVQAWRFPWGDAWPPTIGAGNYAGEENKTAWGSSRVISGYRDGQTATAPVATFQANAAGFFDMGGNAIEICGSWIQNDSGSEPTIALLGASWMTAKPEALQLDARDFMRPQDRFLTVGFRCILAPVAGSDAFVLPPLPQVAQDLPPGAEAFDKKLIGIWEAKSPSPAGTVTWRWEQESDGNYTLAGPVSDAGHVTASGGRMQQVSELTGLKTAVTYKFNTSTQLVTHGPLGEATWKRISSTTTKAKELARNNADSGEEKKDGGQPVARERTVDRHPAPKPKPKPKPAPNIERRAKEFGNSMRRRFGL